MRESITVYLCGEPDVRSLLCTKGASVRPADKPAQHWGYSTRYLATADVWFRETLTRWMAESA